MAWLRLVVVIGRLDTPSRPSGTWSCALAGVLLRSTLPCRCWQVVDCGVGCDCSETGARGCCTANLTCDHCASGCVRLSSPDLGHRARAYKNCCAVVCGVITHSRRLHPCHVPGPMHTDAPVHWLQRPCRVSSSSACCHVRSCTRYRHDQQQTAGCTETAAVLHTCTLRDLAKCGLCHTTGVLHTRPFLASNDPCRWWQLTGWRKRQAVRMIGWLLAPAGAVVRG